MNGVDGTRPGLARENVASAEPLAMIIFPGQRKPGELSAIARKAVESGIPDSTRRAYSQVWRPFERWCNAEGFAALDATGNDITEYVTRLTLVPRPSTGRPYAPTTLDKVVAAIRSAFKAAGRTVPDTTGARKVISGYRDRLALAHDPAAQRRKVTAATPEVMRDFVKQLDTSTFVGLRDQVVLLYTLVLAARASDLVWLNIESVRDAAKGQGLEVTIYRRKTRTWQTLGVPYGSNPVTCPVRTMRTYLARLAEAGRTTGPLFVRVDRHGNVGAPIWRGGRQVGAPDGRLSTEAVSDIVERTAARTNRPGRFRSHSGRRGFVTASLRHGADPIATSRHGGWADGSREFQGYAEEEETWSERNPLFAVGL